MVHAHSDACCACRARSLCSLELSFARDFLVFLQQLVVCAAFAAAGATLRGAAPL